MILQRVEALIGNVHKVAPTCCDLAVRFETLEFGRVLYVPIIVNWVPLEVPGVVLLSGKVCTECTPLPARVNLSYRDMQYVKEPRISLGTVVGASRSAIRSLRVHCHNDCWRDPTIRSI